MYIYVSYRQQYPKFTSYVRDSFPKLIEVPNVVNALQVWGFMTMEEIRKALEWQEGDVFDTVSVEISEPFYYEDKRKLGPKEFGRTPRVFSEVAVSPKAVQAFEDGKGVSITGYGLKVYTVGAQMLGQLVYNYAGNHYWKPSQDAEVANAKARQRRQGFFGQVYGGTPC
ncbi:hypothetical protein [Terrarubrum flagellatum]|uniref:hypothetical protein n=1 Tax=Terrirubrum flagellatum TaxID=2895980 RepID=UPI0031450C1C